MFGFMSEPKRNPTFADSETVKNLVVENFPVELYQVFVCDDKTLYLINRSTLTTECHVIPCMCDDPSDLDDEFSSLPIIRVINLNVMVATVEGDTRPIEMVFDDGQSYYQWYSKLTPEYQNKLILLFTVPLNDFHPHSNATRLLTELGDITFSPAGACAAEVRAFVIDQDSKRVGAFIAESASDVRRGISFVQPRTVGSADRLSMVVGQNNGNRLNIVSNWLTTVPRVAIA